MKNSDGTSTEPSNEVDMGGSDRHRRGSGCRVRCDLRQHRSRHGAGRLCGGRDWRFGAGSGGQARPAAPAPRLVRPLATRAGCTTSAKALAVAVPARSALTSSRSAVLSHPRLRVDDEPFVARRVGVSGPTHTADWHSTFSRSRKVADSDGRPSASRRHPRALSASAPPATLEIERMRILFESPFDPADFASFAGRKRRSSS